MCSRGNCFQTDGLEAKHFERDQFKGQIKSWECNILDFSDKYFIKIVMNLAELRMCY